MKKVHVVIVGSGIAGLFTAINIDKRFEVTVLTKKKSANTATNLAQGGIAGLLGKSDTFQKHFSDTLKAGCYHNDKKAVTVLIRNSKEAIEELIKYGVRFSKINGQLALTKEGGHSMQRIAFHKDITGQEIERALLKQCKTQKNIKIIENVFVTNIVTKNNLCHSLQYLKNKSIKMLHCDALIFATGGIGQIYSKTTNPEISTGDGIAIAIKNGIKLKDMEFVQFHPTAHIASDGSAHLLSEALRGEGAHIIDEKGNRFIFKTDERGELAARDVVARAIFMHQKEHKIYLDIRHIESNIIDSHFPNIEKYLKSQKLSLKKDLIPITPVAHYLCGGIKVNLNSQTSMKNVYAVGEVACTGVHGANRLASNSLLEAVVFGKLCAKHINKYSKIHSTITKEEKIKTIHLRSKNNHKFIKQIQNIMWDCAGIIRSEKKMKVGLKQLSKIEVMMPRLQDSFTVVNLEANNILTTAKAVLEAALKRKKSLGTHYLK